MWPETCGFNRGMNSHYILRRGASAAWFDWGLLNKHEKFLILNFEVTLSTISCASNPDLPQPTILALHQRSAIDIKFARYILFCDRNLPSFNFSIKIKSVVFIWNTNSFNSQDGIIVWHHRLPVEEYSWSKIVLVEMPSCIFMTSIFSSKTKIDSVNHALSLSELWLSGFRVSGSTSCKSSLETPVVRITGL